MRAKGALAGLTGIALAGCISLAPPSFEEWLQHYVQPPHVQTSETRLENGFTRHETAICHTDNKLELQLKYVDAQGNTKLFVSLARHDRWWYCSEEIAVVDAAQEFPETTIIYDDHCNGEVDRFSMGFTGGAGQRVMNYREVFETVGDAAETNDAEFAALRDDINRVFNIRQKQEDCEALNE